MPDFQFLNRDLSWLSFNRRVLAEASDASLPLYARISFLSIFSSNLDEFFRVRMPAILAFNELDSKKKHFRDEYPEGLMQDVITRVQEDQENYGRILTQQILPGLRGEGINLYYGQPLMEEHRDIIRDYFLSRVLSFLQPVFLEKDNQAEIFLENNALYFLVEIETASDPGKRRYALLNIPSCPLPRFLELPESDGLYHIVFLDDIIRDNLQLVFPGHIIHNAYSVKLTRDAEMELEDEFLGDIADKIEKQLEKRDLGHSTRFLYQHGMPDEARLFIKDYLGLGDLEMVEGGRYHNLKDLGSLPNPVGSKLKLANWPAIPHPAFQTRRSIFQTIATGERLLHLPYHSYNYILRFFNEAAIDPDVSEIYVTLYRVAADSQIVNALISAAKNGKKVIVFVELKARFDEANNLRWSKKMKAAGVKIINSIPGLKVHAKVALVKRREEKETRLYSLMATGNFNEATGRFYTDHVYFTANPEFGGELQQLFDYLQVRMQPQAYGKIPFKHLLVSQFNLIKQFGKMIDREIANVKKGGKGHIIIKLNNLQERAMIEKLYEASNAGVKVEMIVRSICCLAPGIPGQSENITVHRIVDRYLEHARIFVFHNNGHPEYYMGSADWMNRNLHSRIEVCFPVLEAELCRQLQDILDFQLNDYKKGVLVNAALENVEMPGGTISAQEATYNYVKGLS